MNQDRNITPVSVYAGPSLAMRIPTLCVAVLLSSGMLGGVLGLFEMQSRDATLARAAVPAGAASSALARSDTQDERRQRVVARADL